MHCVPNMNWINLPMLHIVQTYNYYQQLHLIYIIVYDLLLV